MTLHWFRPTHALSLPTTSTHKYTHTHTQSQALLVLPFFTSLLKEPLAGLQRALEELVASHFPMQSDEFPRGSPQYNNYVDCVRKVSLTGGG